MRVSSHRGWRRSLPGGGAAYDVPGALQSLRQDARFGKTHHHRHRGEHGTGRGTEAYVDVISMHAYSPAPGPKQYIETVRSFAQQ